MSEIFHAFFIYDFGKQDAHLTRQNSRKSIVGIKKNFWYCGSKIKLQIIIYNFDKEIPDFAEKNSGQSVITVVKEFGMT